MYAFISLLPMYVTGGEALSFLRGGSHDVMLTLTEKIFGPLGAQQRVPKVLDIYSGLRPATYNAVKHIFVVLFAKMEFVIAVHKT